MAALVLSVAGAAAGGAVFGPAGAIAGRIVGAIGGNLIDRALFASPQLPANNAAAKISFVAFSIAMSPLLCATSVPSVLAR